MNIQKNTYLHNLLIKYLDKNKKILLTSTQYNGYGGLCNKYI